MRSRIAGVERADELFAVLAAHATPQSLDWVDRAWWRTGAAFGRGNFFGFYAGAARRFPGQLSMLSAAERERLLAAGVAAPEVWSACDLARSVLLLEAMRATPEIEHVAIAIEAFRRGDSSERSGLLRALPLLPGPERFTELAVEACRTHVLDVFAAIACENPLPAATFPELNFNQLVIKVLFLELQLPRVIGWRARANPELRRIATDYEAERRAAQRPVPADIALIKATKELP
jgi:hypothetical protein